MNSERRYMGGLPMEQTGDHFAEQADDQKPSPVSTSPDDAQACGLRTEATGYTDQTTGRADGELAGGPEEVADTVREVGHGALAGDGIRLGRVTAQPREGHHQAAAGGETLQVAPEDQELNTLQQPARETPSSDGNDARDLPGEAPEHGEHGDTSLEPENRRGTLGMYVERSAEDLSSADIDSRYRHVLGGMRNTQSTAYQATTAWHSLERALSNQAGMSDAERRAALDEAHQQVSRTLTRLGDEDSGGNVRLTTDKAYQSLAQADAFRAVFDARLDRRSLSTAERDATYAGAGRLIRTALSEFEASGLESPAARMASTEGGKQMRHIRDTTVTLADCLAFGATARPESQFMLQPVPHNGAGRRADASVLFTDPQGQNLERLVKISVGGEAKPRGLVVRAGSIARHTVFPDLAATANERGLLTRVAFNRLGNLLVLESQGEDIGDENRALLTKFSDRICAVVARRSYTASGIPDIGTSARF